MGYKSETVSSWKSDIVCLFVLQRATPTVESLYAECLRRTDPSANTSTNTNSMFVASRDRVLTSQPTSVHHEQISRV